MSQWLASKGTSLLEATTSRRSFIAKAALVGSAMAVSPLRFILRPGTAYAAICNCSGSSCTCGSLCCDGFTEFCCTINNGANTCPPGSFEAGWWAASGSRLCPSGTRYIIDCNAYCGASCVCRCANGSCGNRKTCCNQFRYGQCHQEIRCAGRIACRISTCTPPYQIPSAACGSTALFDNATANHSAPCLNNSNAPSDFVRTPNSAVYRLVGGAPLYIYDCGPLGGCDARSVNDLSGFAPHPANGTFVRAAETGAIYRVAGGAPLFLFSCAPPALAGGCRSSVSVNAATISFLDHLRGVPANGTYLRATETGAIYRVAGGAPLYISSCAPPSLAAACSTYVEVNAQTIDLLDHLNPRPSDGTYLRAAETGAIYRVAGGAPLYISSCAPPSLAAACSTYVEVNAQTITGLDHLDPVPADGTYLRAAETGAIFRVAGGSPLYITSCSPPSLAAACSTYVEVNRSTIDALDHLRRHPVDGTYIRAAETGAIYRVAGGAPLHITSCEPRELAAACSTYVEVNRATIDLLDHLLPYPADGTYIRAVENGAIYRVVGGAALYIDDCTHLSGCAGFVNVNLRTVTDRDHLRSSPFDGTVLQGRPSNAYWEIVGGCRRPATASPAAVQVTDDAVNRFPLC